jgi:hypothetical protein
MASLPSNEEYEETHTSGHQPPHSCSNCSHRRIELVKETSTFCLEFYTDEVSRGLQDNCDFFKWCFNGIDFKPDYVVMKSKDMLHKEHRHVYLEVKPDAEGLLHTASVTVQGRFRGNLLLYAEEGNPFSRIVPTRPIVRDPASDDSLEKIRRCMKECSKHQLCPKQGGPGNLYGARVVHITKMVDDTWKLLLEEPKSPTGGYAALSYCWGGPQNIKLTRENFNIWTNQGISVEVLPPTLKDAVETTYMLGCSYLWVDVLCKDSST